MKHLTPVTDTSRLVHLRRAEPGDATAVARLWHDGWHDGHAGHVPLELLAHRTAREFERRTCTRLAHATVATAEQATTLAGFVVVHGPEVEQLYVDVGWRGTGVARRLLAAAEQQIRAAGEDVAWLAVAPGNRRARRFYERWGWVDDGPFENIVEISDGSTMSVPCRRYVKRPENARP